jgi:hypothetical protein
LRLAALVNAPCYLHPELIPTLLGKSSFGKVLTRERAGPKHGRIGPLRNAPAAGPEKAFPAIACHQHLPRINKTRHDPLDRYLNYWIVIPIKINTSPPDPFSEPPPNHRYLNYAISSAYSRLCENEVVFRFLLGCSIRYQFSGQRFGVSA